MTKKTKRSSRQWAANRRNSRFRRSASGMSNPTMIPDPMGLAGLAAIVGAAMTRRKTGGRGE